MTLKGIQLGRKEGVERWENSENKVLRSSMFSKCCRIRVFKNICLSHLGTKPGLRGPVHSIIQNQQSYWFKKHVKANLKIWPFLTFLKRKVNSNLHIFRTDLCLLCSCILNCILIQLKMALKSDVYSLQNIVTSHILWTLHFK